MISFDLFYGISSFILNTLTFLVFLIFYIRIRKSNVEVFLARIFLKADRFIYAFTSIWIGLILLTIGYAVSFVVAFSNPSNIYWEYSNIATFLFLFMFMFFLTGLYTYRPIKHKEKLNEGTTVQNEPQQTEQQPQNKPQDSIQNDNQQNNSGESK